MTETNDTAVPSFEEACAPLIAPGGIFEMVEEDVLGQPMRVFKNRAKSLRELLAQSANHGDAEYVVFGDGRRWSYTEHLADVASVAQALHEEHGIGPGDRVAILAANSPEWILTFWATVSLGGVVVAMNGWWAGDEIRYGLETTKPKLLIADRRRLERLEGDDPGVPVLVIEDTFEKLRTYAQGASLPDNPIAEDDPAVVLFTSGTTGRPKAPVLSHRSLIAFVLTSFIIGMARRVIEPQPEGAPGALLAPFPLFHVSGLFGSTISTLVGGQKTVWPVGRFDPGKVIALTNEEGITNWMGASTHIYRLLTHPDIETVDTKRFSNVGAAGSATSPELARAIHERFPHLSQSVGSGYGSTESGAIITYASGEMLNAAANCVGPPLPGVEVKIIDEEGNEVPEGEVGIICARSPMVMLEYDNNPEATKETILPGRWLDTGDFGRLENGRVYLESRLRDMIIRGGENVYPAEIENRLEQHPDVAEVAVIGVDDIELGQEVKAVIVPRDAVRPDEESLRDFVAEALAYFKVPRYFEFRDDPLPRNATGKVLKHVVAGEGENIFVEE
ncbi:MAG: class I adenylate-forming enzyme family protein [Myxococcota bacterium]|jgi:acyl-CoA synthetase (AMP-forming)/AMP-acid ligase II|nr:class I adenylate-forming enzyme family protein [Myxococcota bacterium]